MKSNLSCLSVQILYLEVIQTISSVVDLSSGALMSYSFECSLILLDEANLLEKMKFTISRTEQFLDLANLPNLYTKDTDCEINTLNL
jgi:hypothetical protein